VPNIDPMNTHNDIAIQIPKIYLPRTGTDLSKWAVIACDQFTSQPDYWQGVTDLVDGAPSTLNLILPEVFLEKAGEQERIDHIQASMQRYLENGMLVPREGLIFVERKVSGKSRKGIVLCLDLECYDYMKGSSSLIRATEGTIVERLPPRMKIRRGALLELPHILVLIDDPNRTVIEPLAAAVSDQQKLYDFDLMLGSGHLTGYSVNKKLEEKVIEGLQDLARPEVFAAKYGVGKDKPVLLFAMGDGNHSLATAKAVWQEMKPHVRNDHPARYALVEIENIHDTGLEFEPIHRVLFGVKMNIDTALKQFFGEKITFTPVANGSEMIEKVERATGLKQTVGLVGDGSWVGFGVMDIRNPTTNLAVGSLQEFLDSFLRHGGAEKIDYVHGTETVFELGKQPGNIGFYVPAMNKSELFRTVILDGSLPRKTFSMGEAKEKRFYMEARMIGEM
jgi:uncharacterized protein (DUF1015 family)